MNKMMSKWMNQKKKVLDASSEEKDDEHEAEMIMEFIKVGLKTLKISQLFFIFNLMSIVGRHTISIQF
jgi:hypothetical protein